MKKPAFEKILNLGWLLGALLVATSSAQARDVVSPFGDDPVVVTIGNANGHTWACFKKLLGASTSLQWLVLSGETTNVTWSVRTGAGNDRITVFHSTGASGCSGVTLSAATRSGVVYAGGGNDTIAAGKQGDVVYGGSGRDWMSSVDGFWAFGEGGPDVLFGGYNAYDILVGGDGDDCLDDLDFTASVANCGPGNDAIQWSMVPGVGCESAVTACPYY